jgi:GWxTD domain-containing protein
LDSKGGAFKTLPASVHHKPGESAVIMTGFSIVSLKPGQYTLKVDLADGSKTVSGAKDFVVLATPQAARQAFMQTLLADFPEADHITNDDEAAAFRNDIMYIAAPDQLKLYDSLNLTGKAAFQKRFWDERNPVPSSPLNQYKYEHYRRLKYANAAWGKFQGAHAGWKTDRGRVYILYGEPDDIERYPSSLETRSWERWWYNGIEGGVYFVFVDFETSEDYKLVHSSKKNEISDPNWEDKINMNPQQR